MMNWSVRLAHQAEQDIQQILVWTAKQFGERQVEIYTETLSLALEALIEGPDVLGAQVRDEIASGIRTLHVARQNRKGRHFIVFRIYAEGVIDVLRVLHDSMDLQRYMKH
ncbi:MAG: type II toxin-antitoxin system RelE/ParE family toxin [Sulfuricella sp.]|nr:type II toxin-antitoxin system RelE/ParE family toxin [Sulfuricella sp.]